MLLLEMLLAIVLAMLLVALLAPADRYGFKPGKTSMVMFFLLFFTLIWVTGAWLTPVGPAIIGVYWLSFVIPTAFLLLLLYALDPGPRVRKLADSENDPQSDQNEEPGSADVAASAFFWVLFAAAIVGLILYYI